MFFANVLIISNMLHKLECVLQQTSFSLVRRQRKRRLESEKLMEEGGWVFKMGYVYLKE